VRPIRNIVWTAVLAAVFGCLAFPAKADAQPHHVAVVRTPVVVAGGFYSPFWFYDPFWGPWYGYGYYGYPYPPYYPYGYSFDPGASLKLEVKPRQAEVYVDNYYAGIVNDFDGLFQRLPITPGQHELTLYLDGYRTAHQNLLVSRGTLKVKYTMEHLGAGEQQELRPQAPPPPPRTGQAGMPQQTPEQEPPQGPPVRRLPPQPMPPPGTARSVEPSPYGSIAIRVQPADADVLIDGERWHEPETSDRLVVEVPEGRHTVEIRKAGFRTYVTDVQVRAGDTTSLNVSLRTQHDQ